MNSGDNLAMTMHDTTHGLQIGIDDLSTGQSGSHQQQRVLDFGTGIQWRAGLCLSRSRKLGAGSGFSQLCAFRQPGHWGHDCCICRASDYRDTTVPAEYFLDSLDPFGTFDNRLGVWAMTNRQSVTSGNGVPNLHQHRDHLRSVWLPAAGGEPRWGSIAALATSPADSSTTMMTACCRCRKSTECCGLR